MDPKARKRCRYISIMLFVYLVQSIRHLTVQSSYKLKIPSTLTIPSCKLKLGQAVGQGMYKLNSCHITWHFYKFVEFLAMIMQYFR